MKTLLAEDPGYYEHIFEPLIGNLRYFSHPDYFDQLMLDRTIKRLHDKLKSEVYRK